MTYTITNNQQFNSIEISFKEKPSEAIRTALKNLNFRWHSIKKVWYGYSDAEAVEKAIGETKSEVKTAPTEKKNKYGVKVGDIFSMSWGYEQTNVDFFQVVELVGESSVKIREVYPEFESEAVSGMSEDRTYKITSEILPPASRSIFIKDQEHGDLKRLSAYNDDTYLKIDSHYAYKCNGDTRTEYVSWYA